MNITLELTIITLFFAGSIFLFVYSLRCAFQGEYLGVLFALIALTGLVLYIYMLSAVAVCEQEHHAIAMGTGRSEYLGHSLTCEQSRKIFIDTLSDAEP